MKFLRTVTLVFLPIIALMLGWQLGASYEWHQLESQRHTIENLFTVAAGSGQTVKVDPEKEVDISLLWSVWRLLDRHYVDPSKLDMRTMVFGAVSGLVSAVGDPYTVFMTPEDTTLFQNALSGTLEGIGAQLDMKDGLVIVVSPLKSSPAEKAGLQPRDIIIEVDGTSVENMALESVVALIRGPKGSSVTLTVSRPGNRETITMTVVRDAIHIPSVESSVVKTATGSVGLVVLNQFGTDSVPELRKALQAFKPSELKGIVLDLRYNGGGFLDGAVDLVSMFVPTGTVVSVAGRDGAQQEVHRVTGDTILPDIPLVVLINGGSASASEITAGALQDHKRATVIGTQSFGKGTVQEIIDLPGGASLRVTIAHWLTPSGHDLGKKGVTPDYVVERTTEEYRAGYDPQLLAAEAWLTAKKVPVMSGSGAVKTATGSEK